MKVRVAEHAGFCWGVRRAVDRVIQIADTTGQAVYTLGPLIHNPQAVEHLESKNVHAVDEPAQAVGGTLVFRAHGITPQVRDSVKAETRPYSDATCPDVGIIASAVKKHYRQGYFILIYGKQGHAETIGLQGYAPDRNAVVRAPEDVEELPADLDKVCLVSQSTMNDDEFDEVAEAVRRRYQGSKSVEIHNTICEDTRSRQQEVVQLAREVDAMVVVGGRNSSNTNHLAELSRGAGARTFHIETEEELDPADFAGCREVGVTAGASTPNWRIERVRDTLASMEGAPESGVGGRIHEAANLFVRSNLYLSLGAAGLSALCMAVIGTGFVAAAALAMALFVFTAHTYNQRNHLQVLAVNDPSRHALLRGRPFLWLALPTAAGLGALALGAWMGPVAFLLVVGPLAGAVIYRLPLLPSRSDRGEGRKSFSQMPGSKDLFMAGAWGTVASLVPAAAIWGPAGLLRPAPWIGYLFVFCLVAVRSILSDIRDLHGDRVVGRETLPLVLGRDRTRDLLISGVSATGLLLVASVALGLLPPTGLLLLAPLAWSAATLVLYRQGLIRRGLRFELLVDGTLWVATACALLL